jgi:hypothetical protein
MDKPNSGVESLSDLIHKEKKQKKTTDKRSIVDSPLDNSSIVQGNTRVNSITEQLSEHQNRRKAIGQEQLIKRERLSKQTRNLEIDASLHSWVMEGLVDRAYLSWVAKCCHTLGLETVNRLAINARNGKQPQRLFSSLLKGSINLKAKQDYYDMETLNPDTANGIRTQLEP